MKIKFEYHPKDKENTRGVLSRITKRSSPPRTLYNGRILTKKRTLREEYSQRSPNGVVLHNTNSWEERA